MDRPLRGTPEWYIHNKLMAQMSRAGRKVKPEQCVRLAVMIQQDGHKSAAAKELAKQLGLDPKWLPRQKR